MMLADQDLDVHAEFAGAPENLDHASGRAPPRRGKARHFHVDDGAIEFRQTHAAVVIGPPWAAPASLAAPASIRRPAG